MKPDESCPNATIVDDDESRHLRHVKSLEQVRPILDVDDAISECTVVVTSLHNVRNEAV